MVRRLAPRAMLARLVVARDSVVSAVKGLRRDRPRWLSRRNPAGGAKSQLKRGSAGSKSASRQPRRQSPRAAVAKPTAPRDSLATAFKSLAQGVRAHRPHRDSLATAFKSLAQGVRAHRPHRDSLATTFKSLAQGVRAHRPHRDSPAVAASLSFVWPGLGQLLLGRRRAAALLALPALLIVVLLGIQLSQGALMFAASMWNPSYSMAVTVAVVGLGVLRAAAVCHAFLSAPRERRSRPLEVGFVAALLVVIVAMHGLFAAGAWAWYDTSVSIQVNDLSRGLESTDAPASGGATDTPFVLDTSFGLAATEGAQTPARPPNPNRITFLLVGFDWMEGRSHNLTDSLMLVSMDTSTGKVAIVSVPRDTSSFELYYGGWVPSSFKINTLLNSAKSKSFGSPDEPMKTLENEIGFLVGVPVDYYAALELGGFGAMIDAVGGVDVYNPHEINDLSTGIVLGIGQVHLNGQKAMKYVRSREGLGGSDYARSSRQQDVLVALKQKVTSPSVLPNLGRLLSLAGKYIATDFPLSTARDYVAAVQHVTVVEKCVLAPPYSYHPPTGSTGGYWTSQLDMTRVARLSVELFGQDSRYYGRYGVEPEACVSNPY
jgi:LCP family protein required for cell wall assembly